VVEEARIGVLVMAHGTPATVEGIEPFYTRIRRGHPPSPEQLADLVRRYEAIGGVSPLAARTAAQVSGLATRLEAERPGRYLVDFGAKHTDPSIEEAAASLAASGVEEVVGLVLTPHRSSMGSGEYLARAARTLAGLPAAPPFTAVEQWWEATGFAELLAGRLRDTLSNMPDGARPAVLFTAHSLPQRVVGEGDPYPDQVTASAVAVAAAALDDRGVPWQVAWQSAGRTPEPWIGPDILSVIPGLGDRGFDAVVLCPIGFVSDHLEVLYDLDVEARAAAEKAGLGYSRTASLNDDPAFLSLLAGVVAAAAGDG
jgi:protoporphyrin/coproporphyrin ferrochelatase